MVRNNPEDGCGKVLPTPRRTTSRMVSWEELAHSALAFQASCFIRVMRGGEWFQLNLVLNSG
jgi:hypothetical protein